MRNEPEFSIQHHNSSFGVWTMLEWLNGKKTYIGLIAAGLFGIAMSAGWIEWNPTTQAIATIIGTWTGVGFTNKVDKAIEATKAG